MKKILIMLVFVIISLQAFGDSVIEGENILKNEPFFYSSVTPGSGVVEYSFNNKWYGFQDCLNGEPATGQLASCFKRNIIGPIIGDNAYFAKALFSRSKEESQNDKSVYITSLPGTANHINVILDTSYIYNIGFSFKANDICFDPSFNDYGFTCSVSWYNSSSKLIKTDIRYANSSKVKGEVETLTGEYLKYSTKVMAPTGAKYFTYSIFASKGVYTDNNAELLIAEPFMIPESCPVMDLNITNTTNHSIYNNRYIKSPDALIPDLQAPITCVASVNFDSSNFPVEYMGLKTSGLASALNVSVYNANTPNNLLSVVSGKTTTSLNEDISLVNFNINWSNLQTGKYVVKAQLKDGNVIIGEAYTYFYVENYNELTQPYGPVGTNLDMTYNTAKNYWLKINGVSTFLLGVIDRGVSYNYLNTDTNGWPYTNDTTSYKSSYILHGGSDLVGANEDVITDTYNGTFTDYLHNIYYPGDEAFSYEEYADLGLNFVYPANFAHLDYLGANKQIDAINELKKKGIYVFYPMEEYFNHKLSRDIDDILKNQFDLNGKNVFGSLNAFNSVGKIANSSDHILGYVTDENVNGVDLDQVIVRKEILEKLDVSNPTAITFDFSEICQLDDANTHIKNNNLNKAADVFIVNIKPSASNGWTTMEINNLTNTDDYVNYINKLDKPVIINLTLAYKQSGGSMVLSGTPLTIMDMKSIYNKFKSCPKVCGIIYDNASSMRIQKNNITKPKFDYNLFKIFLYELENNLIYNADCMPIPLVGTDVATNPILGVKCGLKDLKNVFSEFTCIKKDLNKDGKDDYIYTGYAYTNTGNFDLQFKANQECFDLFTLNISIKKGYCFETVVNVDNIIAEPNVNSKKVSFGQNNLATFTFLSK